MNNHTSGPCCFDFISRHKICVVLSMLLDLPRLTRLHVPFGSRLVAIALAAFCTACGPDHSAAFLAPKGVSITIELRLSHPTLAEYDRKVILTKDKRVAATWSLMRDTGGYAAANLYRCSAATYMLDSYGDSLFIDAKMGTVQQGKCRSASTYLGVFDGGGSEPWRFIPASQREEKELRMLGG